MLWKFRNIWTDPNEGFRSDCVPSLSGTRRAVATQNSPTRISESNSTSLFHRKTCAIGDLVLRCPTAIGDGIKPAQDLSTWPVNVVGSSYYSSNKMPTFSDNTITLTYTLPIFLAVTSTCKWLDIACEKISSTKISSSHPSYSEPDG